MTKRCVIIGASPETDCTAVSRLLREDDTIVCADGGCRFAEKIGIVPDIIVGDFDSSEKPEYFDGEMIVLPVRKDETDMMAAARFMAERGYREIVFCGVSGGRPDHAFGAYCTLKMLADRGVTASVEDGKISVCILTGQERILAKKKGCGFGIFPFGCSECEVSLDGFDYNTVHARLTADLTLGSSNRILSDEARVDVHQGTAILFIYQE